MDKETKPKIIAAIGTAIFYLILFLILAYTVLERIVPEEEEGLEIAMGTEDFGAQDFFEPTPASEVAQELEALQENSAADPGVEEYQTQNIEESVAMQKEKSDEELKREREEAEKRKLEQQKRLEEQRKQEAERQRQLAEQRRKDSIKNAIAQQMSGFKGGGTGAGGSGAEADSKGVDGNSSGSKGNPFGTSDSQPGGLATEGSNNSYSLSGRAPRGEIARPVYNEQVEGRIIVSIKVDKDGNVFDASIKGGTIVEESVRQAAIAAAKKTKFNKIEGNHTQYGTITYNLKLK